MDMDIAIERRQFLQRMRAAFIELGATTEQSLELHLDAVENERYQPRIGSETVGPALGMSSYFFDNKDSLHRSLAQSYAERAWKIVQARPDAQAP